METLEKQPGLTQIHLLNAYILYQKMNNRYKALYELAIANSGGNASSLEEFSIYRYTRLIEQELRQVDEKLTEERGINVNS
jgi:PAS domain S-box-containing protein